MISIDDIDIFIMTHNRCNFVLESINSIINSTAGVKKITVLDNDSVDETENVIKSINDERVKYVKTHGFLGNFKKAKELVNNKYVMLFHDDDVLHKEYLEKVISIINLYDNVSLVTSRYTEFFNDCTPKMEMSLNDGHFIFSSEKSWARHMYYIEHIAYATAVYRSDAFIDEDLEYDKFNKFNDWPFMIKMAKHGNVILLDDPNAFFIRRHCGQDTWTSTNVPSLMQIVNWDKFFYECMGINNKNIDNFYKMFSYKSMIFSEGKFNNFYHVDKRNKENLNLLRNIRKDVFGDSINSFNSDEICHEIENFRNKMFAAKKNTFCTYINKVRMMDKCDCDYVDLSDILEIVIVTYNREKKLQRTFDQIFSKESPIKNLRITILDNNSTDGTRNVIEVYKKHFPNITHIIHNKNIGGNANICRAFEIATYPYVWVLCDDDEYNWEYWHEIENALLDQKDLIVVANYLDPSKSKVDLIKQLTFVPAAIYSTKHFSSGMLINAYFNISYMFPQLAISSEYINKNLDIYICKNWAVNMCINTEDCSYSRGCESVKPHPYMMNNFWQAGFATATKLIEDEELRGQITENINLEPYRGHEGWTFILRITRDLFNNNYRNLTEIFCALNKNQKVEFIKAAIDFYGVEKIKNIISEYFSSIPESRSLFYDDILKNKVFVKKRKNLCVLKNQYNIRIDFFDIINLKVWDYNWIHFSKNSKGIDLVMLKKIRIRIMSNKLIYMFKNADFYRVRFLSHVTYGDTKKHYKKKYRMMRCGR